MGNGLGHVTATMENHVGIVLNYCQCGSLYLGSYYNTGPYIVFPHFGNKNFGKLPPVDTKRKNKERWSGHWAYMIVSSQPGVGPRALLVPKPSSERSHTHLSHRLRFFVLAGNPFDAVALARCVQAFSSMGRRVSFLRKMLRPCGASDVSGVAILKYKCTLPGLAKTIIRVKAPKRRGEREKTKNCLLLLVCGRVCLKKEEKDLLFCESVV